MKDYRILIDEIYKALLLRKADSQALKNYSKLFEEKGMEAIPILLKNIINSEEFFRVYTENIQKNFSEDPYSDYKKPCYMIIHIPKTAGISLRKYLYTFFKNEIYPFPTGIGVKSIIKYPLDFLLKYQFIMGHIDYDFIKIIPREKKFLITFLRNPINRMWSAYNFWKSIDYKSISPEHMDYKLPKDANELDILDFFSKYKNILWNEMSRFILGSSLFSKIKTEYFKLDTHQRKDFLESYVRPIVKDRLNEFFFIGLQEDYERSLKNLIKRLGKEPTEEIPRENITKKKEKLTDEIKEFLKELVEIDNIVYEEGKKLYYEKFAKEG